MRLLEESYGNVRIFSERPYGYKRYIVRWDDTGEEQIYSGLWYKLPKVKELVLKQLQEKENGMVN
tara:strand:- start:364 stop:558 length:195 start_codon:yes stop_codon:yes gene_type:complete